HALGPARDRTALCRPAPCGRSRPPILRAAAARQGRGDRRPLGDDRLEQPRPDQPGPEPRGQRRRPRRSVRVRASRAARASARAPLHAGRAADAGARRHCLDPAAQYRRLPRAAPLPEVARPVVGLRATGGAARARRRMTPAARTAWRIVRKAVPWVLAALVLALVARQASTIDWPAVWQALRE